MGEKEKELSISLQIQAYLTTASDELYASGKPLHSEDKLNEIHQCMLMWQKLHNHYFKDIKYKTYKYMAQEEKMESIEPTWSIKDAKAGDVLANDHHILILKELDYDWYSNGYPYSVHAYCGIKPNGNFELGKEHWCFCGTLHMRPATKEERELLFAKMREAGYEWDEKKKELKKIEKIN